MGVVTEQRASEQRPANWARSGVRLLGYAIDTCGRAQPDKIESMHEITVWGHQLAKARFAEASLRLRDIAAGCGPLGLNIHTATHSCYPNPLAS